MGAPTIYYYDDVDAPVITPGADSFYQIMRACLIDGYGSKAAAGWSVVYDDWATSGVLTITNVLQTGILGLKRFSETSFGPGLFVCEAMIDSVTPVNARSGYNELTTLDDLTDTSGYQRAQFRNVTHAKWVVIANENTVFFWSGDDDELFSAQNQQNGTIAFLGFGAMRNDQGLNDNDLGNFAIIGGNYRQAKSGSPTYTMLYDVGRTSGPSGHGTIFYSAGQLAAGEAGGLCYPWSCTSYDVLVSDSRYMPLSAVYYVHRDYGMADGVGVGLWPMLFSSLTLANYTRGHSRVVLQNYFDASLASLRDTIMLDGKTLTACSCGWNLYAFVSLDAGDWL